MALQALLHDMRGEQAAALAALEQAVHLAEPGGLLRVFIDLGSPIASLLTTLAAQGVAPEFVARLLDSFPATPVPVVAPAADTDLQPTARSSALANRTALLEPLTRREQEVLELLAQHLTAEEVAQQLVISAYTVKRHRANIYQKLGVNRRRDALAAAQALGLLAHR